MKLLNTLKTIGVIGGTFIAAGAFVLLAPEPIRSREIANAQKRLAAKKGIAQQPIIEIAAPQESIQSPQITSEEIAQLIAPEEVIAIEEVKIEAIAPEKITPKEEVKIEAIATEEIAPLEEVTIGEIVTEKVNTLDLIHQKYKNATVAALTELAEELNIPTYRAGQNRRKGKQELLADIAQKMAAIA